MKRTQIYLDGEQTARLDERATSEGSSRSVVIRRAVDLYLSQEERESVEWQEQWRKAIKASAGIAPYLERGAEVVEDIRRADAERLTRLAS